MKNISIFYDGQHLKLALAYYHDTFRKTLDLSALHRFIGRKADGRVTTARAYQGRSLPEYVDEYRLHQERYFDLALAKAGIQSNILPLTVRGTEKGVDVWLALDVFEQASLKQCDVAVLVSGDSDYVPLLRKLKMTGVKSMALGWSIPDITRASQVLMREADQAIAMEAVLDDRREAEGLFVSSAAFMGNTGVVTRVSDGYGFIAPRKGGPSLFFHHSEVKNRKFNDVCVGDPVEFEIGTNQRGECAREVRVG